LSSDVASDRIVCGVMCSWFDLAVVYPIDGRPRRARVPTGAVVLQLCRVSFGACLAGSVICSTQHFMYVPSILSNQVLVALLVAVDLFPAISLQRTASADTVVSEP
jgi:hypothetical protein